MISACTHFVQSHPGASLLLLTGSALASTGYAVSLVNQVAQKFFSRTNLDKEPPTLCGESRTLLTNGNTVHATPSEEGWKIDVFQANEKMQTISWGADLCGPPVVVGHPSGFVVAAAKVAEGNTPSFDVMAQSYDFNGGTIGSKMALSMRVPFNPATTPNPITAAPFGDQVAIAWQESQAGAITNRFTGAIISQRGAQVPFFTQNLRAFDGPPLLSDLGREGLGISWVENSRESGEALHYFQRIPSSGGLIPDPIVIGSYDGDSPADYLEPGVGNHQEREVAPFNEGFVYVRRDQRNRMAILGTLFNRKGHALQNFTKQLIDRSKKCYPQIKKIAADAIRVICHSTDVWYDQTIRQANTMNCRQRIYEWWRGSVSFK